MVRFVQTNECWRSKIVETCSQCSDKISNESKAAVRNLPHKSEPTQLSSPALFELRVYVDHSDVVTAICSNLGASGFSVLSQHFLVKEGFKLCCVVATEVAMGVRYHFGFRVGQGVVNTRFSGDPNVGRLYGTSLPTFGWFRYPSVGESSVRRLIAAAALAAAASGWN